LALEDEAQETRQVARLPVEVIHGLAHSRHNGRPGKMRKRVGSARQLVMIIDFHDPHADLYSQHGGLAPRFLAHDDRRRFCIERIAQRQLLAGNHVGHVVEA
jgi:hypothetical protein